jgi:prepilin-type N-terminal cleavage/methylation domain-containing protein
VSPRTGRRGFTLLEGMMSMLILSVGILGVTSMQTATTGATANAQDFTQAQSIAERMTELLRVDSLRWTSAAALAGNTLIMKSAIPPTNGLGDQSGWTTIPDGVINASMQGAKVDRNFNPDVGGTAVWPVGFRYCVYYRLAWAWPPIGLRADVRVAWARDSGDRSKLVDCAADAPNVLSMGELPNIRMVSASTMLSMNTVTQ